MNEYFKVHNCHIEGMESYLLVDPQLKKLANLPFVWTPPLVEQFCELPFGIYTLSGGRQIGKSTLLKQWVLRLIKRGVAPENIIYFTGELIDGHHKLIQHVKEFVDKFSASEQLYIICDEITYISNWDQGIKFLADAAILDNVVMMLSGSDSSIIKESRNRFPGRRGRASQIDFTFSPLSFSEVVALYSGKESSLDIFKKYLLHGGFLSAINDLAINGEISDSTYNTYSQWIIGDMQKKGKQESYVLEIITAIIKQYGSQISWNSLAKELSIDHHKTVSDYIALLSDFDVVFIQHALLESKLTASPKKAKKLFFKDPFIYHTLNFIISNQKISGFSLSQKFLSDSQCEGQLVEQVCVCHVERKFHNATYYIKAEGEVDIAYVDGKRFYPIEIKWTKQIRSKDLKQIRKYSNAEIWGRFESHESVPVVYSLIDKLMKISDFCNKV